MTTETPIQTAPPPADPGLADETFGGESIDQEPTMSERAAEWLTQLQTMIENLTEQAKPVIRDVGIKAAELAALAGEKAGPAAQRAAEFTGHAGMKLAERSRDLAAELRRDTPKAPGAEAELETELETEPEAPTPQA